jgi:hypothetical protein
VPTWTCPGGCGSSYAQNDPDLIVRHVGECDYVDGSGQEYDVTVKWSAVHWYITTVKSSDLAAVADARPFAELIGLPLDRDDDDPDGELPAYLDELAGGCDDPETDGWEIGALYDARRDQPRTGTMEGEMT